MKKTFTLVHPKIKPARLADAIRFEIKRYLKRERRKVLPEGKDCWEFDCKYGPTADKANVIQVNEIRKSIENAEAESLESFYLEILARPGKKPKSRKPAVITKTPEQ